MDDSGKRAVAALTNVGRGTGDSAGRSKTAEEGGNDIGKPLADEFLVGTVARTSHAVGDDRREQRFDSAEHGDGEGGQNEGGDFRPAEIRQGEGWQFLRDAAVGRADGGNAVKLAEALQDGCRDKYPHRRRDAAQQGDFRHDDEQRQRHQRDSSGGKVHLREAAQ